jgi:3-deoxy-D-manno-octulosonic-acid transferase
VSVLLDLFYLLAAVVASPWIAYRLIARGDWRELAARFGAGLGKPIRDCIWLHGSSAGEIALLTPLVRLLESSEIDNPLVISAYSSTGVAAARKSFPQHRVIVFPFDLSFVVRRVLRRLDPRLIVIVESEYWPNFLLAVSRRRVPVAVINAKMSERSFRFHARTRVVPLLLRRLTIFAVQTSTHEQRLRALGIVADRVHVTGNMKYDLATVPGPTVAAERLRERLGFARGDVVIIGGSVHEREDAALIDAYIRVRRDYSRAGLVIAPRYPQDTARVERLAREAGLETIRKTALEVEPPGRTPATRVLIVDTVGELRALYTVADVAFVGGSLFYRGSNKGGHNLMEPAILGLPVVFGPFNFSFEDAARALVAAQAGYEVRDAEDLAETLRRLLGDTQLRAASGRRAREVIVAGQGATRKNFELLAPLIEAASLRLPVPNLGPTMPPAV